MDDEIFRITKDNERAKDLFVRAKDRFNIMRVLPRDKPYKFIEEYYEVIKELLTALMYIEGYKTLSHKKLIEYFSENYRDLDIQQIKIIDTLRKFRNESMYYGKIISEIFLTNNEDEIKHIIQILIVLTEKKLREGKKK